MYLLTNEMEIQLIAPIYTFFPSPENPEMLDEKGEKIPLDFYDPDMWVNYKIGVCCLQ